MVRTVVAASFAASAACALLTCSSTCCRSKDRLCRPCLLASSRPPACGQQRRLLPRFHFGQKSSSRRIAAMSLQGGWRRALVRTPPINSPLSMGANNAISIGATSQRVCAMSAIDDTRPRSTIVQLLAFLTLWYAFNAAFNVQNKLILNSFPYPWVVSWVQLATGMLFVLPAWGLGLRTKPKVDAALLLKFAPMAALHCAGHGLQVASMGSGSVFFTHVIKATEPLIGMFVVLIFTGTIAPWWVNVCLLPIVIGVAYAAGKDGSKLDLSELFGFASVAAFLSTVAFAIAKLLAKQLMSKDMKRERNLDAANNYGVLTCCSSAMLLLPSFIGEGAPALAAFANMEDPLFLARQLILCGFLYYGYNEMGFRVLDIVSPVSAAVCNSLKRVAVLLAAVLFLGEDVTQRKIVGSAIAIFGVLLYSIAKAKAAKLPEAKVGVRIEQSMSAPGRWQP